jgi:hypothetical protein
MPFRLLGDHVGGQLGWLVTARPDGGAPFYFSAVWTE